VVVRKFSSKWSHCSLSGCRWRSHRVAETLSAEVLDKLKAPPKPNFPVLAPAGLKDYDAFLFGIPTRFGNMPAQWKVRLQ